MEDLVSENQEHADVSRYLSTLDKLYQEPHLRERLSFAEEIYSERSSLLTKEGIDPTYASMTFIKHGEVQFINSREVEIATLHLTTHVHTAVEQFNAQPSKQTFTKAFASIVALGELSLFDAKDLRKSFHSKEEGKTSHVGINPKQIDAAVSVFMSHTTRVDSGQGKSNPDAVIASVAKVLLKKVQSHTYVHDQYARERDAEQLHKMTDLLQIPVFEFSSTEDNAANAKEYGSLIEQREILGSLRQTPRRKDSLRKITTKIRAYEKLFTYNKTRDSLIPPATLPSPAIAIGTNSDFVFAYLRGKHPEIFAGPKEVIIDEELAWRSDTANIIESFGPNAIQSYLPDWIAMAAATKVCESLERKGLIAEEQGALTFIEPPTDDSHILVSENGVAIDPDRNTTAETFDRMFERELLRIQRTGKLPKHLNASLLQRIKTMQSSVSEEFIISGQDIALATTQLIKTYATVPDTMVNSFYAHAWMQAQLLKEGTEFGAEENSIHLIDRHTGEKLATHKYQDLQDVAVDVSHGVCMLRERSQRSAASTGYLSYLDTVYGKGHIAILTATLQGIEAEIGEFTGKNVVESSRWIGEQVAIPEAYIVESQKDAFRMLNDQLKVDSRPYLIVTDNDQEVRAIEKAIRAKLPKLPKHTPVKIHIITSSTSLEDEKKIYGMAGDIFHITIANPKAGRMIDIKTTNDAEDLGGLRVVPWGPLYSTDVLFQVLQRTKRAGHKGDAGWVVYKHGGHVGLENHKLLSMFPNFRREMEKLESGTSIPYEDSILEKLHIRQFEMTTSRRLQILYEDRLRSDLAHLFKQKMVSDLRVPDDDLYPDTRALMTPALIEKVIQEHLALHIQQAAHTESRDITNTRSFSNIDSFLKIYGDSYRIATIFRDLSKSRRLSPIPKIIENMKADAIETTGMWKYLHEKKKESPGGNDLVLHRETQHPTTLLPKLFIDANNNVHALIPSYSSETVCALFPNRPDLLVTVKKKLVKNSIPSLHQKRTTHVLSFRITQIDMDTGSISDDIGFTIPTGVQNKNNKLSKKDQDYLPKYITLLSDALKSRGANVDGLRVLRRKLVTRRISTFGDKQIV